MKNLSIIKSIGLLLAMLLAVACSKEETLLSPGDELSDALKGAPAIGTLEFLGWSNYLAYVPKSSTTLDAGGPPCMATLNHNKGKSYTLKVLEGIPGMFERHVEFPLKITPGGVVSGSWPATWYDWGNPPSGGSPNTDVVPLISGHLGCDLHGPGINKGTIICKGTFDGTNLFFVFRFNGLDTGIPSTMPPNPDGSPPIWDQIDGPAKFEFSFDMDVQ